MFGRIRCYQPGHLRRQRLHRQRARSTAQERRLAHAHPAQSSKDKALSEAQERRNRRIASPRARVEHVFARLAQLGGKTLRSCLARATLHLNWKAATYNLRLFVYLKEAGGAAF